MPSRLADAAARAHARRIDLHASNVPGPRVRCTSRASASRISTRSGPFPVDPAAVSDVDLFLECVRPAFRELLGDPTPV
jgi:hypothetical protein